MYQTGMFKYIDPNLEDLVRYMKSRNYLIRKFYKKPDSLSR